METDRAGWNGMGWDGTGDRRQGAREEERQRAAQREGEGASERAKKREQEKEKETLERHGLSKAGPSKDQGPRGPKGGHGLGA